MDYFFWDEIFGGRQQLADELLGPQDLYPDEPEARPDIVPVVIAWVEDLRR
ncbi:MAG: hypothetical protein JWM80_1640 [Cyanobacteria bacterium RYN_339]|nr:hypothetical protein [Cyanobacteria bacterium RYN_339]